MTSQSPIGLTPVSGGDMTIEAALRASAADADSASTGEGAVAKPAIPDHVRADPRFKEFVEELPMEVDLQMRAAEIDRRNLAAAELVAERKRAAEAAAQETMRSDASKPTSSISARRSESVTLGGDMLRHDQRFVLLNLAGRQLNPKSRRPALRILGMFQSPEHARQHVARLQSLGACGDVDLHLVAAQRPFLIPMTREQMQNQEFVLAEIKARQAEYAEYRRSGKESLDKSVESHQQGARGTSAFAAKIKSRQRVNAAREKLLEAAAVAKADNKSIGDVLSARKPSSLMTTAASALPRNARARNAKMRMREAARPDIMKAAAEARKARKAEAEAAKAAEKAAKATESDKTTESDKATESETAIARLGTGDESPEALAATARAREEIAAQSAHEDLRKIVDAVPEAARLASQRFAVVAFLLDYSEAALNLTTDPKPACCVYAAFSSVEDAEKYIETTASRHETDFHLDVVDMYEWLHPEDVDDEQLTEVYRDPELNRIMNARKREKQRLEDFGAFCKAVGQETPLTDVVLKNRETGEVEVSASSVASGWKDITLVQKDSKTGEVLAEQPPEEGRRIITTETPLNEVFKDLNNNDSAGSGSGTSSGFRDGVTPTLAGEDEQKIVAGFAEADSLQDRLMKARAERAAAV
jgi:hypothetical protein